ncbi:hypothetical protein CBW65_22500 [Tumebacillus avium]|uniref:Uncharacterized protein n=1 Tax=Tumebacillus avium TaxID=1903704 RepID=A0A1Y0IS66_9BACL|nr:hypothetical protein [Tumebacillus avium]ARU63458.1 hypothetical protein CBW65_22500 [Tumebacillus avium]
MKKKLISGLLASAVLLGAASAAYAETEYNDMFEYSNFFAENVNGTIGGEWDVDYFKSYGCGVMYLDSTDILGEVNLYVYNSERTRIGIYDTYGDDETVSLVCGTYYFRVTGFNGSTYILDWR